MAFLETLTDRVVMEGVGRVKVTLAEAVRAGDPLGISDGTWVLSAHASAEQPILIAGEKGIVGQEIDGWIMAVIKVINTSTNVATVGEKVALSDGGLYQAAGTGLPDVGFAASIGSDNLSAILFLNPTAPQLTVVRT